MVDQLIRFEEFELDVESCELRRAGRPVKLERIPMELLILLLQNPGKLVRREAINDKLWGPDIFLESDHSINTAINKLRAILRDDSREPRFIRTVVGQGYRFIATVHATETGKGEALATSSAPLVPAGAPASTIASTAYAPLAVTGNLSPNAAETQMPPAVRDVVDHARVDKPPTAHRVWIVAGILAACAALLAVVATVYVLRTRTALPPSPQPTGSFHSVAVLPFRDLAQNSEEDYLVDGMTDQLITDLARSTSLRVISQRSVMQYKGVQESLQGIAKSLNADAIVEGSYLRVGQEVRITAQLLDAQHDQHLWAQTYEGSTGDSLQMRDQVTNDIAHQVALSLGSSFAASRLHHVNEQARDAYLRGRHLWNERTLSGLKDSVKYYSEAIRADPTYADAYAALAESYVLLGDYGGPNPADPLSKAQFAAERALELDRTLGEAHTALGAVKTDRDWDWSGAEREYRRAIELNPSDPTAHHWYSLHLSRLGQTHQAEVEIQRALALDPLSLIIKADAAETAYWARRPEVALTRIQEVLALNPDFGEAHLIKGKILEELHQYLEAQREFDAARRSFGGGANVDALRGHAYALEGAKEQALAIAASLEAQSARSYVSGIDIAVVYCGLAQPDDGMRWLNRAYERHDKGINMLRADPLFDGCRADPRFAALVEKLKLSPTR